MHPPESSTASRTSPKTSLEHQGDLLRTRRRRGGKPEILMSGHTAIIAWKRTGPDFVKGNYSREHTWTFDGGLVVPASPSPSVVRAPFSNPSNVDPEEAFVASISSCHMLTFLYLASRQGFQVDAYQDEAEGVMTKNEKARPSSARSHCAPGSRTAATACPRRPRCAAFTISRTSSASSPTRSSPRSSWSDRTRNLHDTVHSGFWAGIREGTTRSNASAESSISPLKRRYLGNYTLLPELTGNRSLDA